jgi:SAM-dependent methyltransferase
MHDTALDLGRRFFAAYCADAPASILDVGAMNVYGGTLRDVAPPDCVYTGVDLEAGDGVDIVLDDPHVLPFEDETFDAIVSSSCLEHDTMFWLTFIEIVRVTKTGGFIYLNAPSNGSYHCHPVDNWRFYPDAGVALAVWARRLAYDPVLIESFIAPRIADQWNDCVMVFRRGQAPDPGQRRIVDELPGAFNVRRSETGEVENLMQRSEDMLLIAELQAALAASELENARLTEQLRMFRQRRPTSGKDWVGFEC